MLKKLNNTLVTLVSVIWISIIIVFYFNRHPEHFLGIKFFKFSGLILSFLLIYFLWLGLEYLLKNRLKFQLSLNGISIIILSLAFSCLCQGFYQSINGFTLGLDNYLHLIGNIFYILLATYLIFGVSLLVGKKLLPFFLKESKDLLLLQFCVGCMFQFIGLFILALFHIFNFWPILIYYVLLVLVSYDYILDTLKDLFLKPFYKGTASRVTLFAGFLLILYLTVNMNSFYGPFPLGFDSRNLYFNIPSLVSESNGLISGFGPYNWSIIMALGFQLFSSPELTLMLSFAPVIVICLYIIHIAIRYYKVQPFLAFLLSLAFVVSPAVTNHLNVELKIDLGLLMIQLGIFELLIIYWKEYRLSSENKSSLTKLFIILGLLSGFALTIKFTHAFLVFTILIAVWILRHKFLGFLAMFASSGLMIYIFRIDDMSGLRNLNLSANFMMYTWFFIALISLILIFYRHKKTSFRTIVLSSIFILGHVFFLSGWLASADSFNIQEIKSTLTGSKKGNQLGANQIIKNYKKKNK